MSKGKNAAAVLLRTVFRRIIFRAVIFHYSAAACLLFLFISCQGGSSKAPALKPNPAVPSVNQVAVGASPVHKRGPDQSTAEASPRKSRVIPKSFPEPSKAETKSSAAKVPANSSANAELPALPKESVAPEQVPGKATAAEEKISLPDPAADNKSVSLPSPGPSANRELSQPPKSALGEAVPSPVPAEAPASMTVLGTMSIDFGSRSSSPQSPDTYRLNLKLPSLLQIKGDLQRKPRILSRFLGREKQPLELVFKLNFFNSSSRQDILVGSWNGSLFTDAHGISHFLPTESRGGVMQISSQGTGGNTKNSAFSGQIRGKPQTENGSLAARTLHRLTGRPLNSSTAKTEVLNFENLILAAGPLDKYPQVHVSGALIYDYDTGNWQSKNLTFKYTVAGVKHNDSLDGIIKWIEEANSANNRKGKYSFNLKFNQSKFSPSADESEFFASAQDEESFFKSGADIPFLGGEIKYQDFYSPSSQGESQGIIVQSQIDYSLLPHRLTEEQLINFLKLWLLLTGPVNDE